ncbi:MAG: purine-nucleoside phosphorylase [Fibrobacterota bacterium]
MTHTVSWPTLITAIKQFAPKTAIILGSGWSGFTRHTHLTVDREISYAELQGFPPSTVEHQRGAVLFARIKKQPVLIFNGRYHLYEGHSPDAVTTPVNLCRHGHIQNLILTNAAGACSPYLKAGNLMVIEDQINFTGLSPLRGKNNYQIGPRYPSLHEVYSKQLYAAIRAAACHGDIFLYSGIYGGIGGPETATPAEIRMYYSRGADVLGMSTVFEAIAAVHAGLFVGGISLITDDACCVTAPPTPKAAKKIVRQTEETRNKLLIKVLDELWEKPISKRLTQK